ncbi:hypothetical protein SAMN05518849_12514 [Sphingobium sp. AP50]|nr:hypothetical protein SAMN05518849_12514 [Sphingobium sp. AP50]
MNATGIAEHSYRLHIYWPFLRTMRKGSFNDFFNRHAKD